ncbi:30S ribosomal protein S20 [Pumilibacter muris]|uniref:30S ribosomal protein S20 n=1 Tax=Pumilibacter muris TaxID=2941510 RepID=UPI00203D7155|nr:30S ribosomal protein S20 [Pumilibacter muris]
MPNIKSAKKRVLIIAKKNEQNRAYKTRMNHAIKKFNNAIDVNDIEGAEKLLPETMSVIDQTASKGVIHKNQAANKKSALAKRLSDVKSGKLVIVIKKDNKTIAAEKAKAAQEIRAQQKAEYQAKAAERKAARLEAEKAKLEAEQKAKKGKKKDADKKAEEPKEKKTKKTAKTEEKAESAEAPAEKPKAKRTTKKAEKPAEETPAAPEEKAE